MAANSRQRMWTTAILAATLVAVGILGNGFSQQSDPVERLRAVLKANGDAANRDRAAQECLVELRTLSDLRRAYLLPEWRDRTPEFEHADIDRTHRTAIAERYAAALRGVLRGRDAEQTALALEQIAEVAGVLRGRGEDTRQWWSQEFLRLARQGSPRVRVAAARAIGQTDPPLEVAVPALANLRKATDPAVRIAGIDALAALVQGASQSPMRTDGPVTPEAQHRQIATVQAIAPAVAPGLTDPHVAVRRRCVSAIAQMTSVLTRLLPESNENGTRTTNADLADLKSLALTLRDQAPGLARALRDADVQVRLLALKALEELAVARGRWLRAGGPGDPLLDGLLAILPALTDALTDSNVRVRRAVINSLEPLGPAAAPAVAALAGALNDNDRFVRWSAVRTLGGLGPAARPALPALKRIQMEADPDIRRAATTALGRIEPAGHTDQPVQPIRQLTFRNVPQSQPQMSVPELMQSLKSNDVAARRMAAQTLLSIGAASRPALPALRLSLRDPDAVVRQAAALALGQLGSLARDAADELRVLLADPDPAVRRAAGDALIRVYK